jgi:hypothetical protein
MARRQRRTAIEDHCNDCGGDRSHSIVEEIYLRGAEGEVDYQGDPAPFDVLRVQRCGGCDAATVVRILWEGGKYYKTEDGEILHDDLKWTYWPPRTKRPRPTWIGQLPEAFQPLMNEVYEALAFGAPTLAAIGVRTVIDLLARKAVGDVGTFRQKLDALQVKGWLGELDRDRLAIVVDAGNAAAHRGFAATSDDLDQMMESLEHLLKSRYVLDPASKKLKRATPKRTKRKKAAAKPATAGKPAKLATPAKAATPAKP